MKKIAIIALSLISAAAFAQPTERHGSNGPTGPEIKINAPSVQITSLSHSSLQNGSSGTAAARQNVASNTGNVTIDALSLQVASISNSAVSNSASDNAAATQNLASNMGKVNVGGAQLQLVAARNSYIGNTASGGSSAVQNVSSNNGCQVCN